MPVAFSSDVDLSEPISPPVTSFTERVQLSALNASIIKIHKMVRIME